MKKILTSLFLIGAICMSYTSSTQANFANIASSSWWNSTIYCDGTDECSLTGWIDAIKGSLWGIETTRSARTYIQDVVKYLLGFISLIAIIYIIYSWFMIMVGNGDEEKLKKSKQTILYVVIGIAVMWMAYPITLFVMQVLNAAP